MERVRRGRLGDQAAGGGRDSEKFGREIVGARGFAAGIEEIYSNMLECGGAQGTLREGPVPRRVLGARSFDGPASCVELDRTNADGASFFSRDFERLSRRILDAALRRAWGKLIPGAGRSPTSKRWDEESF